jgi:D-alanine transaminase
MGMVFVNGAWLEPEQATVSVFDRGFLFGDGIYEVMAVYGRHPFRLGAHLRRLNHSLGAIRLPNPMDNRQWAELIAEAIARESCPDQAVYIQITRGVAPRDHAFPDCPSTIVVMSNPLKPPPASWLTEGIAVVTMADSRWQHCDIKTTSLLANVLLRQAALDAGAVEAVLLRDGQLTEGAASSILVAKNGVLHAPPPGPALLPGITAELILALARRMELPTRLGPVSESVLRNADELWLASTTREVVPITMLDRRPVGDGHVGPLFRHMHQVYQEAKRWDADTIDALLQPPSGGALHP